MKQPVAVTGMGIVSSTGEGVPAFADALFHGRSYFSLLSRPPLSFPVIGAPIQNFSFSRAMQAFPLLTSERQHHLEKMARTLPFPVQVAVAAALEAWHEAELNVHPLDARRIGLVVAAQNTTNHYQYDLRTAFQQNPDYLSPVYALHFMDTDHVGVLSEVLGIRGEGFTVEDLQKVGMLL